MLKLLMLTGLLVAIAIVAADAVDAARHTAAEIATPQQVYFRLHTDDELVAKP